LRRRANSVRSDRSGRPGDDVISSNIIWRFPLQARKLAIAAGIALFASLTHAATNNYTAKTAPDTLSKQILAHHYVSFEDGATGPADTRAAIHRDFAKVIEQNLAQMPAKSMTAWLDGMSDAELRDLAQLYVNANADTRGTGSALQVFATRLDGPRLARLAKHFGYQEMNAAVLAVAPLKAQSFAASVSIVHAGPVPGAALMHDMASSGAPDPAAGRAATTPMPTTDMSITEIYLDFRTAPIGSLSAKSAIFETAQFAGMRLFRVGTWGYAIGTQVNDLMEEYAPDFYYGTFVPVVGGSIDAAIVWTQDLVTRTYNYFANDQTRALGAYQARTLPEMGVSPYEMNDMLIDGGDLGMEEPFEYYEEGGGACYPHLCNLK
jgi:hypothetical protein